MLRKRLLSGRWLDQDILAVESQTFVGDFCSTDFDRTKRFDRIDEKLQTVLLLIHQNSYRAGVCHDVRTYSLDLHGFLGVRLDSSLDV